MAQKDNVRRIDTAKVSHSDSSTTKIKRDGKKVLNPQAAQYYKRLILVSDRYLLLLKRNRKTKVLLWFVILGWVATILVAIKPLVAEVVQLIKDVM